MIKTRSITHALILAAGCAIPAAVSAQSTSVEERLNALEAELQAVKKENAQLRRDLGVDGRAGQTVVKPAGREPALSLGGLLQVQADALDKGDARFNTSNDRFYLRRARINAAGKFLEEFDFRIELELAGSLSEGSAVRGQMTDGYINWNRYEFANIRAGQFKTGYGYEQLASDPKLFTIERSLANDRLTLSRQIGAQLGGDFFDKRLSYSTGVYNGTGVNTNANDNDAFTWTGRVSGAAWQGTVAKQETRVTVGTNVYTSKDTNLASQPAEFGFDSTPGGARDNIFFGQRSGAGVDAQIKFGGFDLWAEYLRTRFKPSDDIPFNTFDADGWYVQTSYFVVPKELQAVLKLESFDPNRRLSGNSTDTWTAGLNYLIKGDDLKLMANYLLTDSAGLPDNRQKILLRLQAIF
ncbi:MAG: porin [Nibricoccus sp.]